MRDQAAPNGTRTRTAVLTHPSADLYGSDRQLLESVSALVGEGWDVCVVLPMSGPLEVQITSRGGRVQVLDTPVLRRGLLNPRGLASLSAAALTAIPKMVRLLRESAPDVLYVNTITQPLWNLVGRAARVPTLCHVHEAEEDASRVARLALTLPLLVPNLVVANSESTRAVVTGVVPALRRRTTVVHNGVPGPPGEPDAPDVTNRRVVLLGRLSWRKGTDVALEAVARLRRQGLDVRLELAGSAYTGNEAFEAELRDRSEQADLRGAVSFLGFTSPVWPALGRASVVIVPSTTESFGNVAVEGQLARRPVIASDVQALRETIRSGESGLLVPPRDAEALASAIARVLEDQSLAEALATAGRQSAMSRFTPAHFRESVVRAVTTVVDGRRRR